MIAAPCNVGWENMTGTDTVRHCHECKLNVYNVSRLTAPEAERLLNSELFKEGKICFRLYRRHDGTLITADCPVGLRKIRSPKPKIFRTIAAATATFVAAIPAFADDAVQLGNEAPKNNCPTTAKPAVQPGWYKKSMTVEITEGRSLPIREMSPKQVESQYGVSKAQWDAAAIYSKGLRLENEGKISAANSQYMKAQSALKNARHDQRMIKTISEALDRTHEKLLVEKETRIKLKLEKARKPAKGKTNGK